MFFNLKANFFMQYCPPLPLNHQKHTIQYFFFFLVFGVCWFVGFCLFGFLFVLGNTLNFSLYRKTVPSPSPAFSNWDWIILQMSLKKTKPSFTVKNGNYFLKLFQRLPSHMQILITYPPSWPAQTRNTCIQRNRLLW